mmetsp:Transcript_122497/g.215889  ORF Transcript_122497/g.215889 Transcript_122497/m.215889 type:complete len:258 (-) Transcript_122497:754-1527(-)
MLSDVKVVSTFSFVKTLHGAVHPAVCVGEVAAARPWRESGAAPPELQRLRGLPPHSWLNWCRRTSYLMLHLLHILALLFDLIRKILNPLLLLRHLSSCCRLRTGIGASPPWRWCCGSLHWCCLLRLPWLRGEIVSASCWCCHANCTSAGSPSNRGRYPRVSQCILGRNARIGVRVHHSSAESPCLLGEAHRALGAQQASEEALITLFPEIQRSLHEGALVQIPTAANEGVSTAKHQHIHRDASSPHVTWQAISTASR